ncbi:MULTISPECIES: hypothetical protein [unclassified Streptomyces]|uniref:hypothetical protein n=1 Tax=unclassified Streptomyces TaxID=2593676 RepID=UPI00341F524D
MWQVSVRAGVSVRAAVICEEQGQRSGGEEEPAVVHGLKGLGHRPSATTTA